MYYSDTMGHNSLLIISAAALCLPFAHKIAAGWWWSYVVLLALLILLRLVWAVAVCFHLPICTTTVFVPLCTLALASWLPLNPTIPPATLLFLLFLHVCAHDIMIQVHNSARIRFRLFGQTVLANCFSRISPNPFFFAFFSFKNRKIYLYKLYKYIHMIYTTYTTIYYSEWQWQVVILLYGYQL